MHTPRFLIFAAAVLLAVLSWWLVRDPPERDAPAIATPVSETDARDTVAPAGFAMSVEEKIPATMGAGVADSTNSSPPDWSKRIYASDDLWAFAESAIGPARRGDGNARYWLALALAECEISYPYFFNESLPDKPPRRRTLDEALQHLASGQRGFYSDDDVVRLEKRCSRLSEATNSPFGNVMEWMDAALAVDNPLAQADKAFVKASVSADFPNSKRGREANAEARKLLLDAVRTREAEAFIRISDAAATLAFDDEAEANRRRLSWVLAACLRTPDCEGLNQWRKFRCNWDSQCQPYETPRDIIRRDAGSDFDEVERRARELNEKIDADTLDESDF